MTKQETEMIINICVKQMRKGNKKPQIKRLYLDLINELKVEEIRNANI